MADPFMAEMQKLFDTKQHTKILAAWGADTSNSTAFKRSAFAGYQPGPQDVIISTYPKSGTTWALQTAYQIGFLGNGEYEHSYNVFP